MAMTKCKECGADVSNKALKCPTCGVQLRKPKRGFFGSLYMALFILFNLFMILWMVVGINATADVQATTEAEQVGKAIGATLGFGMVLTLWVMGDVILGLFVLFTRPKG